MVSIERITPDLGAEVRGLATSGLARKEIAQLLRQALIDHHLLVVRARQLSAPEQIGFAQMFGVPEHWGEGAQIKEYPAIYRLSNQPGEGYLNLGRYWHADGTILKTSTAISVWHVIQHPEEGGDTLFQNMHRAYDELPESLRARIETLQMTGYTGAVHPVVQTHPVTGRKALYASIRNTKTFAGMGKEATQALLQELDAHLERPDAHYCHKWQVGDVIVGDNFSVAHKATMTDPRFPRVLHRVTIRGDAAFYNRVSAAAGAAAS